MAKFYDLARVTVASAPGTGSLPLGPAVYGFLTFPLAGVQNGDVVGYAINDGQQSEIGYGTYATSTNTLSRDHVYSSTNGGLNGSKIAVSATAQVFITLAAEDVSSFSVNVFDNRNSVATEIIPVNVTTITINRYSSTSPVEPARYVRGVSSSPLAVLDALGNYWTIYGNEVYPEYFGAQRNGTNDDSVPIRSAMSYLHGLGVPAVLRLRTGTYFLATETNQSYITLYTQVSIIGEGQGSVLRVTGLTAFGWIVMAAVDNTSGNAVNNVEYRDFAIDGNGSANVSTQYMAGIVLAYTNTITIDNVTVFNFAGSQPIALGTNAGLSGQPTSPTAVNVKITNCKLYQIGSAVNPDQTDFSCIYVVATDTLIANNEIWNTTQDTLGTGIELHGTGVCNGNVITQIRTGFIVGSYPDTAFVISGNKVRSAYAFASVWDTVTGTPVFNTKAVIVGNFGSCVNSAAVPFIDLSTFTAGTGTSYVKIADNLFESLEATGGSSTEPVILYGKVFDVEITNNTAKSFAGGFVLQGSEFITNAQTLRINGNTVIDCCTSAAAAKTAISISSANALRLIACDDNVIQNTSTIYMTTGIGGNSPVQTSLGIAQFNRNVFFNVTTPYNWTGTGNVQIDTVATVATTTSASFFPLFAASSTNSNQVVNLGTGITFNPSTNTLTTTTFSGAIAVSNISGLGTGVATFLVTPTSANLAAALTDETGTGAAVFAGSPALTGTATAVNLTASGNLLSTAEIGYAAGAGGAVTQLTSRTTSVTLNHPTGAITLFAAAGSTSANTFTVSNSAVAATDVVQIVQKSGTNVYAALVTAVAAGSFNVTFYSFGGTATDSPVFNFAVIKGVAS